MELRNKFKEALRNKVPQIGLWLGLCSPYSAEILGGAGFDWLLIDGEHAPNDVRSILLQLQALAPYPVSPVVRAPFNDPVIIKQLLDIGAMNLLIPMVEDAKQASEALKATWYPPRGIRGVGSALARSSRWNKIPNYLKRADDEILVIVQIETRRALGNLPSILELDSIDAIFIGPADLSADMGHIGEPNHEEVRAAIELAIRQIKEADKAPGILMADRALAQHYLDLGALFVAVGVDTTLLSKTAEALAKNFKGKKDDRSDELSVY